jgi:hypothetical protein
MVGLKTSYDQVLHVVEFQHLLEAVATTPD